MASRETGGRSTVGSALVVALSLSLSLPFGGRTAVAAAPAVLPQPDTAEGELWVVCAERCAAPEISGMRATWRPLPRHPAGARAQLRRVFGVVLPEELEAEAGTVRRLQWSAPPGAARDLLLRLAAALDAEGLWVVDPTSGRSWTGAAWAAAVRSAPSELVRVVEHDGRLTTRGLRAQGQAELVTARADGEARKALEGLVRVVLSQGPASELPLFGCAGGGPAQLARGLRRAGDPPPPLVQVELPVDLRCAGVGERPASLAQLQTAAGERLHGEVQARFVAGDGDLVVKLPFPTRTPGPDQRALGVPTVLEWLWVAVDQWEGETIQGTLVSAALREPGLVPGTPVSGNAELVFDYLWRPEGGDWEGNRTATALPAHSWDPMLD